MSPDESKKQLSTDELAAMTARGFEDMQTRLNVLATKNDLVEFRAEVKENFRTLQTDVASRLDLFLKTIRLNHEQRLSRAEADIHELQQNQ